MHKIDNKNYINEVKAQKTTRSVDVSILKRLMTFRWKPLLKWTYIKQIEKLKQKKMFII